MIATNVFSLLLIGLSGLLLDGHRRARQRLAARDDLDDHAQRFAGAQYRRRMQASGTIGLVGAGIALRPLIPHEPLPIVIYLAFLLAACAWIVFVALVDALATTCYYRRLRADHVVAEVKLAKELEAMRDKART